MTNKQNLKILLAEDNFINQRVITGYCSTKGWQVTVAQNGREAITCLEKQDFDIILMDIQMPDMNGLEATKEIRSRNDLKQLPIIAVTAHALQGDEERFIAVGMDRYIKKPIDFNLLESTICEFVGEPINLESKTVTVNDFRRLMDSIGMEKEFVVDLVTEFLQMYEQDLQRLQNALAEQDLSTVSEIAHKLKGAIGNFGAEEVRAIFYDLELASKERNLAHVQQSIPVLKKSMTKFVNDFDKFRSM